MYADVNLKMAWIYMKAKTYEECNEQGRNAEEGKKLWTDGLIGICYSLPSLNTNRDGEPYNTYKTCVYTYPLKHIQSI